MSEELSKPFANPSFDEEAIRPAVLVEEMERLCDEDRRRLMRNREEFVSVACPACENAISKDAFIKYGVDCGMPELRYCLRESAVTPFQAGYHHIC